LKRFLFLFLFSAIPVLMAAQTFKEFWFVVPEVTSGHCDQPLYLRLNSFEEAATVTITQPANTSAFTPIVVNIPANGTTTVDLTSLKNIVENKPPDQILNYGIFINATKPITAYYEESCPNNTDIFTLKGFNALGTEFYIPSQDYFSNHVPLTPQAYNTFDIVATEDNTTVTITPSNDIVGHAKNSTFVIVLNKGQTYSAQAMGTSGASHLMGSHITADKPIAITFKDDSVQAPGQPCYDLIGDQIVPVTVVADEYVVVRGYLNSAINDRVFIVATQDNTDIFLDGNTTPVTNINATQLYSFSIPESNPANYIESSHPVYVLHVSGYGCEVGGALLPPINCTGSSEIAFVRTTQFNFGLIIITKDAAKGSFTIDGNSTLVTASQFSPVPGNSNIVYARIEYTTAQLPVGPHIIQNSNDIFHLGIINASTSGNIGCRYGYFSDFASLSLGPDSWICPGTTKTLDAGPNRNSYTWYFNGVEIPGTSGQRTILASDPGTYSVTVDDHGCILSDDIIISNYPAPTPDLGPDQSICPGQQQTITLNAGGPYLTYLWNTGATTQSIDVNTAGFYSVTVTDNSTCTGTASVTITERPYPVPVISGPATLCPETHDAVYWGEPGMTNYTWTITLGGTMTPGPGVNEITVDWTGSSPQQLTLTYTDPFGCVPQTPSMYDITFRSLPVPQLSGPASVCPGISGQIYTTDAGNSNYLWTISAGGIITGGGTANNNTVTVTWNTPGQQSVSVGYTDIYGCSTATPTVFYVTVNTNPIPVITGPTPVCEQSTPAQVYSSPYFPGHTYLWSASGGVIVPKPNPNEVQVQWGVAGPASVGLIETNSSGCSATAAVFPVTLNPKPGLAGVISGTTPVCPSGQGYVYSVAPVANATSYAWTYTGSGATFQDPAVNPVTLVIPDNSTAGNLRVNGINQCGSGSSSPSFALALYPLPDTRLDLCINQYMTQSAPVFLLKGGTPLGGSYLVDDVPAPGGILNPGSLMAGSHTLSYSYQNMYGCSKKASLTFYVVNSVPGCPATFTDQRDDRTYTATLLGGRCWMSQNLNTGDKIPDAQAQTDNCVAEKHCFSGDDPGCSNYGGLYQWDEVMRFESTDGAQGLCPAGWHVPVASEWNQLLLSLSGPELAGGPLKDMNLPVPGFEALLKGVYYMNNTWAYTTYPPFSATFFWTSSLATAERAYAHGLNIFNPSVSLYPASRANAFPVRCVKD